MPFPKCKIHHVISFGSCSREVSTSDPETGVVTTVTEDCNKKLPDSDMFEIKNMIKAGVKLDEVNTSILSSGIDTEQLGEAFRNLKPNDKQSKTNEVKDEN